MENSLRRIYGQPKNHMKLIQIGAPSGAVGSWFVDLVPGNVEAGITALGTMLKRFDNNVGFSVSIKDVEIVVPDSVKLINTNLKYVNLSDAVIESSEDTIVRNIDIFADMLHEASVNPEYYQYVSQLEPEKGSAEWYIKKELLTSVDNQRATLYRDPSIIPDTVEMIPDEIPEEFNIPSSFIPEEEKVAE